MAGMSPVNKPIRFPMPKTISCGVLIFNPDGQLLLAHATGTARWDIPKGMGEVGETAIETAIRETREETSLVLTAGELEDLGCHAYLPRKGLHLFRCELDADRCDLTQCKCTSYFPHHRTKQPMLEVDAFRWAGRNEIEKLCSPKLTQLIKALVPDLRA